MELEILSWIYWDRTAKMIDARLIAWHLIQIPNSHITTEIQFSVFAPAHSKATTWVKFSEDRIISSRSLGEEALVIISAWASPEPCPDG